MAKVKIENGKKVLMHQLQIGEKVQTGIVFLSYMNEEFTTHFIINHSAKLLVS